MGRIARLTAVAVAALALAGCWPVPGHNANRTAYNDLEETISPANVAGLQEAWATDPLGLPMAAPVVSPEGVHGAVGGCAAVTIDAATGTSGWSHSFFPGAPDVCSGTSGVVQYGSPPFVAGDRVLAGTFWWLRPAPSPQFGTRTESLSAATGEVVGGWDRVIAGVRGNTALFVSPRILTIPPGIPVGYESYFAAASIGPLDGSASLRTIRIATAQGGQSWGAGVPTLGEDLLFHAGTGMLATEPGDPATGQAVRAFSRPESRPGCGPVGPAGDQLVECPVWATPIDGPAAGPPVVAPDQSTVYVGTETGTVYALDADTGEVQWTAAVGAAVGAEPALARGTLFVPTADGRLVALAAAGCGADTCPPEWTTEPAGGALTVQPAVAGGVVFTGAADGSVHAHDAAGCGSARCPALWSASTGSEITGAPAVSSAQLYVGTADGRLIAYRLT